METKYIPKPLDTRKVDLSPELLELTELLSRNTHEIWARQRIADGWKYGAERNDVQREHPSIIPYELLSEEEKLYDRSTAMETLKVIKLLNYNIEKQT